MPKSATARRGEAQGGRPPRAPIEGRAALTLDLARYVPALLNFIDNKMTNSAAATYRTLFGIGVIEWRCLSLIALEPWLSPQRVCHVIGLDKAAVSRALARLKEKGLVQTRPNALRSRFLEVALTEQGARIHDRVIRVAHERERRLLAALSPAEIDALLAAMHKMHGAIPTARDSLEYANSIGIEPQRGRRQGR